MKNGDKITQLELESSGYRIICQFSCGYVLTKEGVDRNILWDPKTLEIILIYTSNERYATAL